MATTATPREIMSALIEDRPATRRSETISARIGFGVKYILSYGEHFVMAYRDDQGWRVTHARYSATTSAHQKGVREALYDHGFAPTGQMDERGYELWQES